MPKVSPYLKIIPRQVFGNKTELPEGKQWTKGEGTSSPYTPAQKKAINPAQKKAIKTELKKFGVPKEKRQKFISKHLTEENKEQNRTDLHNKMATFIEEHSGKHQLSSEWAVHGWFGLGTSERRQGRYEAIIEYLKKEYKMDDLEAETHVLASAQGVLTRLVDDPNAPKELKAAAERIRRDKAEAPKGGVEGEQMNPVDEDDEDDVEKDIIYTDKTIEDIYTEKKTEDVVKGRTDLHMVLGSHYVLNTYGKELSLELFSVKKQIAKFMTEDGNGLSDTAAQDFYNKSLDRQIFLLKHLAENEKTDLLNQMTVNQLNSLSGALLKEPKENNTAIPLLVDVVAAHLRKVNQNELKGMLGTEGTLTKTLQKCSLKQMEKLFKILGEGDGPKNLKTIFAAVLHSKNLFPSDLSPAEKLQLFCLLNIDDHISENAIFGKQKIGTIFANANDAKKAAILANAKNANVFDRFVGTLDLETSPSALNQLLIQANNTQKASILANASKGEYFENILGAIEEGTRPGIIADADEKDRTAILNTMSDGEKANLLARASRLKQDPENKVFSTLVTALDETLSDVLKKATTVQIGWILERATKAGNFEKIYKIIDEGELPGIMAEADEKDRIAILDHMSATQKASLLANAQVKEQFTVIYGAIGAGALTGIIVNAKNEDREAILGRMSATQKASLLVNATAKEQFTAIYNAIGEENIPDVLSQINGNNLQEIMDGGRLGEADKLKIWVYAQSATCRVLFSAYNAIDNGTKNVLDVLKSGSAEEQGKILGKLELGDRAYLFIDLKKIIDKPLLDSEDEVDSEDELESNKVLLAVITERISAGIENLYKNSAETEEDNASVGSFLEATVNEDSLGEFFQQALKKIPDEQLPAVLSKQNLGNINSIFEKLETHQQVIVAKNRSLFNKIYEKNKNIVEHLLKNDLVLEEDKKIINDNIQTNIRRNRNNRNNRKNPNKRK